MTTKKKLIALGLCFVILVATILSGTVAYFTDEHTVSNTFTSGEVSITLDEAVVSTDSNGYPVTTTERFIPTTTNFVQSYSKIYPGMSITKDPTITNDGDEKAYVAAKVEISTIAGQDLTTLLASTNSDCIWNNAKTIVVNTETDVETAVNGDANNYVIYKKVEDTKITLYFFVKAAVAADEKVVLFDTMNIPADWNNDKQALVNQLKIDVTGYGIQEYGFANGYVAATTAFADKFTF